MAKSKIPSLFHNLDPNVKGQFNALLTGAKPTITISEYAFLNRYLPMLYNFYTGDIAKEEISKFRTLWITEVSKSGYNEVAVVDQAGKTILVVPPVLGRVQYQPKDKHFSIGSVMTNYSRTKTIRGAKAADHLLKGNMGQAYINKSTPLDPRWQQLFDHYKCTPLNAPPEPTKPNDIGYDPGEFAYEP